MGLTFPASFFQISENAALKKALSDLEKQVDTSPILESIPEAHPQQEEERSPPQSGENNTEVLQSLKDRVVDLELENHDLRKELEGFDPAFFEEIEDLKHEHHELTIKVCMRKGSVQKGFLRVTRFPLASAQCERDIVRYQLMGDLNNSAVTYSVIGMWLGTNLSHTPFLMTNIFFAIAIYTLLQTSVFMYKVFQALRTV